MANAGLVATTAGSTTRCYLSVDGARSADDGATGRRYVLACADDAKAIAEANDCRASATAVTITP